MYDHESRQQSTTEWPPEKTSAAVCVTTPNVLLSRWCHLLMSAK